MGTCLRICPKHFSNHCSVIKDMEWNLWNTGKVADPKSPSGSAYGFMKPKTQAIEISNSSKVLQFASRRFLDRLLGGEDGKRTNRQLKDAEFGNKGIDNLRELMDVLPNIDVSGLATNSIFFCFLLVKTH